MYEDFHGTISDPASLAPHGEIDYRNIWGIFKPNALKNQYQVMVFHKGQYGQRMDGSKSCGIKGKILHHDGKYRLGDNKTRDR